jgi:hypothetical protein
MVSRWIKNLAALFAMGEAPPARARAVSMGETPKPPARPVWMGETPKPPARPVSMGETPARPLAIVALSIAVAVGCGVPDHPAKAASGSGLPPWDDHARQVFDDNIDAAAVGLSMEGGMSPRADAFLRERAQTADVVARVRVQTVTVDSAGEQQTYHLGLQVGVPTLTEAKVQDRSFELSIKPSGAAFGIARSLDAALRGKTFVGFIKRYGAEDGEMVLHWHLAADTADVAAAVKEAVLIGEVSGK